MFGVSRQVYYRSNSSRAKRRRVAEKVIGLVKQIRSQMPRIGTRKLYFLLYDSLKELGVGRDRLFRILKANHMLVAPKRQYHVTTNSHHRFRKHKNLIQSIELVRPEQVWVSDITYIGNRKTPQYLALITDAYSKKIVGYDVSESLETTGTIRALKMAVKQRQYKNEPLIHHSDRGFQYCSNEYQIILGKHAIKCSMTESYDPYANAVAERVNGILKNEFLIHKMNLDLPTRKKVIEETVKIYNNKRPHYSCYMRTPIQAHGQRKMKIRTYKTKNSCKDVLATV